MKRAMLAMVLLIAIPGSALADDPDDVATRVSQRIMSPFCDGVTLHDCPSREADELRARIASMASEDMSEEQIIATLEREYGDRISGTPDSPIAWMVPLLAVLVGIALIAFLARKWASRPPIARGVASAGPQDGGVASAGPQDGGVASAGPQDSGVASAGPPDRQTGVSEEDRARLESELAAHRGRS